MGSSLSENSIYVAFIYWGTNLLTKTWWCISCKNYSGIKVPILMAYCKTAVTPVELLQSCTEPLIQVSICELNSLNLFMLNAFWKHIFLFSIVSQHRDDTGSWKFSLWEEDQFIIIDIITVDGLVMQRAVLLNYRQVSNVRRTLISN